MWDMLIVLLVAIIIWFCGSSIFFNAGQSDLKTTTESLSTTVAPVQSNATSSATPNKPQSVVDVMTDRTSQQINNARQAQQQEMQDVNNN